MPSWPRPSDIWFDHHAAAAAVEAIADMRATLVFGWSAEGAVAGEALERWEGMAANRFAASVRARENNTTALVMALQHLEQAMIEAIDDAVRDQARIDDRQADWDAELRAQHLAREAGSARRRPADISAG